jgi:Domain of unknown function (DUF4351)
VNQFKGLKVPQDGQGARQDMGTAQQPVFIGRQEGELALIFRQLNRWIGEVTPDVEAQMRFLSPPRLDQLRSLLSILQKCGELIETMYYSASPTKLNDAQSLGLGYCCIVVNIACRRATALFGVVLRLR